MKKFCKYIEKSKLLIEISNTKDSFNFLIWIGNYNIFWYRKSYSFKYKEILIFNYE